jgi:hypothetical protein
MEKIDEKVDCINGSRLPGSITGLPRTGDIMLKAQRFY